MLEFARLGPHLAWVFIGYSALLVTAVILTTRAGPHPGISFFLAYAGVGATALALASLWGWLLGRLFSPPFAAPVALTSWFIVSSYLQQSSGNFIPVSGPANLLIDPTTLGVRALAAIAVASTILLLPAKIVRISFLPRMIPAILILATTVVVVSNTNLLEPRPVPESPLCHSGRIEYCLWPEDGAYIPLIQSVDNQLAGLPAGFAVPTRMVDYGMSGHTLWIDGIEHENIGSFDPELLIQSGSRWSVADSISRAVVERTFDNCAANKATSNRLALGAWLESRLAGGGTPDYHESGVPGDVEGSLDAGRAAAKLSEADQLDWAEQQLQDARVTCGD